MGLQSRHYFALMKKNWIVWKRTFVSGFFELFCPIALMSLLAIARAFVKPTVYPSSSNISSATVFIPVDYLS